MIDYSTWKTKNIAPTSLKLDPLNPRLPEADESLTQRELLQYLIEHDNVYELARDFSQKGYFPTESLIAIEHDNKKIVVEGNRRLAALKLLINPDSAPTKVLKKKFRTLSSKTNIALLKKVKVIFAPDRTAAAPIIMQKHTGSQIKKWSPIMQGNFFKQLLDGGISINKISKEYLISLGDLKAFLQSHTMYSIACHIDLTPEVREFVLDSRDFPVSTLDRFTSHPKIQHLLGFAFNSKNQFKGKITRPEFEKGYSKLLTDVATKRVDSRTHNTSEQIAEYARDFDSTHKPNHKKKGSFTLKSITGSTDAGIIIPAIKKPSPAKTPSQGKSIIPSTFKCRVEDTRINLVFRELKKLNVLTQPNSTGVMLRVLLDMSVGYHLERVGLMDALLMKHRTGKSMKKKDWYPSLKQMLGYLISDEVEINLNPMTIKAVNKLLNDTNLFSTDTLDFYVHNRKYIPTEDQLRSFWVSLEEIFQLVLVEPPEQE